LSAQVLGATGREINPRLIHRASGSAEPELLAACSVGGRQAVLAVFSDNGVAVAREGVLGVAVSQAPYAALHIRDDGAGLCTLRLYGETVAMDFADLRVKAQVLSAIRDGIDRRRRAVGRADNGTSAEERAVRLVTTNDFPGHRIVEVHGDVSGSTVRVRDYFSNFGAKFMSLAGGEVAGYTELLAEARREARHRLIGQAMRLGANAVVAMRFECSDIGGVMNEILAYGTAVTVVKDPQDDGNAVS
jgi:uncharacterized protein YbjQ (UPF0145 family)